jgi:prenyltransferase beta subunit
MRALAGLLLFVVPAVAHGQTAEIVNTTETLLYIQRLQDPETGGFRVTPDGKPSLRACNGAVKALKALGAKGTPHADKVKAFVIGCYDPKTGAFAEPGGKPDVAITSVGVMVAVELGIPKEKFAGAMGYLKANAKTFEEVRIAAAAVEAWGVKECGFDVGPWFAVASKHVETIEAAGQPFAARPREYGGVAAMLLRLGKPLLDRKDVVKVIHGGQLADGGWGKADKSDQETTYRVMRAFHLLKEKPKDVAAVRAFVAKCRNADGGYGVNPGEQSSMSGVYYAAIIGTWLDGMK